MMKKWMALLCAGILAMNSFSLAAGTEATSETEGVQASPEFYAEADSLCLMERRLA